MIKSLAPWAVAVVAAFAYPLATLAGGTPRFPSRLDCVRSPKENLPIEAVFGRYTSQYNAETALERVRSIGFTASQIEFDGCGYLKVVAHGIPTLAVGRDLVAEAQRVGLHVRLESAGP